MGETLTPTRAGAHPALVEEGYEPRIEKVVQVMSLKNSYAPPRTKPGNRLRLDTSVLYNLIPRKRPT